MATINPYAGDVIQFPAGTPASVISAYYNRLIQNQNIEAAQVPWYQSGLHGLTEDVLNPYLKQIINEPFIDYRKTFDTDQAIRQNYEEGMNRLGREQDLLRFKEQQDNERMGELGRAAGEFADISNMPLDPTTNSYTTGGGVDAYGPYDDPWSVGTFVPSDQVERRPTSSTVTDEMGVREEERPAEDLAAPLDSGKANITTVTPGKKPNSAEVIAQMAAKYPTLDIGRLLQFMGPQTTSGMLDVNKIDAARAEIDRKNAQAEKDREQIRRESELLEGKKKLQESQAGRNQAATSNLEASADRLTALAQSESGRKAIRDYAMEHRDTLSDEEFQKLMSLSGSGQIQETPGQKYDRAIDTAKARPTASKSGGGSQRTQDMHELAGLNTKKRNGSITEEEEARRLGLIDTYKNDSSLVAFMKAMGMDMPQTNAGTSGPSNTPAQNPKPQQGGADMIPVINLKTGLPVKIPRDKLNTKAADGTPLYKAIK